MRLVRPPGGAHALKETIQHQSENNPGISKPTCQLAFVNQMDKKA